ncbi:MAG: dockerin type I repeat-containing protein, partial [Oscillospiraceae bacterium]|nr:dockerin type I repeat-containing protein [Oscillospiraceae bacterium]
YGMHYYKPETPVSARYVRYAVPSGAPKNSANKDSVYCCNIAEIELYGKPHTAETTTTTETEPPKPQKLKGDVDANGKVAVADAVMLVKYLVTSEDKVTDPEAADMNEDGILNGTDLSLLKRELLK